MKKILITASVFTSVLLISLNVSAQYNPLKFNYSSKVSKLNLSKGDYVANEVIVKFRKSTSSQTISNMAYSLGHSLDIIKSSSQFQKIKFSNVEKIQDIIATYNSDPNVLYAEPNYIYKISANTPPTDVLYPDQWALKNNAAPSNDIDAEKAWEINTDCSQNNTIVAVLDTGINYLHDDLKNNMWVNTAEINGVSGVDDDLNGKIDDFNGWDFIENDNTPLDTNGHGTHLAGTIAAEANNFNVGTVGVCWKASLMALRIGDSAANGLTSARIVEGIKYAIDNGAKIINMSFGANTQSSAILDMATQARDKGIILSIAAGNDGRDNEVFGTYPCDYNLDNIICVASVDRNYNMSTFSNFGSTKVDIGAPGTKILNSWPVTSVILLNQGAFSLTTQLSGWSYSPTIPWKLSTQVRPFPDVPKTLTLLSDPSGYGINYVSNTDTTVYRAINFPPADALRMVTVGYIDVPPVPDNDVALNVYGVGNVVPTQIFAGVGGSGYMGYEAEIPNVCAAQTCSVGINLIADGNASVGKGVDLAAIVIEALTLNNSATNTISGTSMAAPHVAGLAALVSSYNPDYNYKDVIKAVLNGGDSNSALAGKTVTGKTINAFGSLTYITKPIGLTGSFVKN